MGFFVVLKILLFFNHVHMYLSLWSTVQVSVHAHGVQKRALDHLELQGVPNKSAGN